MKSAKEVEEGQGELDTTWEDWRWSGNDVEGWKCHGKVPERVGKDQEGIKGPVDVRLERPEELKRAKESVVDAQGGLD